MTLMDHERPSTRTDARPSPSAASGFSASPLYVPPIPEHRTKLRGFLTGLAALGVLGALALAPWSDIPRSGAELRQALQDVGVPRQYRDLMSDAAPKQASAPLAPIQEDPALTSLLGRTPRPLAEVVASPKPSAAAPDAAEAAAPSPAPQPKAFAALATPPKAAPAPPAPVKAEAAVEPPPTSAAQSYRVQIAATGSDAEAQSAWRNVQKAYPDETGGRALSVQVAEVKGRVVRRAIVTGFPTADAAKAFCAKLAAADRGCLLRGKG